ERGRHQPQSDRHRRDGDVCFQDSGPPRMSGAERAQVVAVAPRKRQVARITRSWHLILERGRGGSCSRDYLRPCTLVPGQDRTPRRFWSRTAKLSSGGGRVSYESGKTYPPPPSATAPGSACLCCPRAANSANDDDHCSTRASSACSR